MQMIIEFALVNSMAIRQVLSLEQQITDLTLFNFVQDSGFS